MAAFKTLGPLALDFNEKNVFPHLPIEIMSMIVPYYCTVGNEANKAWHTAHAGLDGKKVCDAIGKNGPLTFSFATLGNNKRNTTDEMEIENRINNLTITPEEDMQTEPNGNRFNF